MLIERLVDATGLFLREWYQGLNVDERSTYSPEVYH